jgi:2-dehydro-3-deoxygalactonokinase
MADTNSMFCVDMGTTRTRVWVCEKEHIWAHVADDFGVRDVARGGTREELVSRLSKLLAEALTHASSAGLHDHPTYIAAAGMITSPLGLANLPHLQAPAGASKIAGAIKCLTSYPGLDLPLLLIPGLVTGHSKGSTAEVLRSDVMRGEEVLVTGMLVKGLLTAGGAVLNLGSHWKFISTDKESRITGSRTTLTGEMIHAVQTQTLLASALPQGRPNSFDPDWLRLGAEEETRSGLSRALFCLRLLEQAGATSEQQRISFAYGAFIEAELRCLVPELLWSLSGPICLVGGQAVAKAWRERLTGTGTSSVIIEELDRDASYLAGLQELVRQRQSLGVL